MRYKTLGRTDLKVSELCFGAMTFGTQGKAPKNFGGVDLPGANKLVASALDAGVNFFDTADIYSNGNLESMLGQALDNRRKDVVIATKVHFPTVENPAGPNEKGLWRKHIMDAVDASLRRLGTDYIDLYQIHARDLATPIEETLRALEDLVGAGKVRYIGCSNLADWHLMKMLAVSDAHGWARLVSPQAYYTIAARSMSRELVPLLKDQGVGLLIWSPLAGGLLAGKFTREDNSPEGSRRTDVDFPPVNRERTFDVIDVMREIAAEQNVSVARIAIAWLLHQDVVTSVIIGAKRLEQLDDNLGATEVRLSDADIERLDRVSALPPEYPGWVLTSPF
jgi:aryl-alcohol dehydrogenase-like predicted oxidoreductase